MTLSYNTLKQIKFYKQRIAGCKSVVYTRDVIGNQYLTYFAVSDLDLNQFLHPVYSLYLGFHIYLLPATNRGMSIPPLPGNHILDDFCIGF